MNRIISESELAGARSAKVRKKICLVTAELAGPFFNGGVGTANRALALVLRKLGYDVDILYTRVHQGEPVSSRGNFADHVNAFHKLGISLKCIDHHGGQHDWQAISYCVLLHLLKNSYGLIFFDDLFGTAYYTLLARRTGNAKLKDTIVCVTAHSSLQWLADLDQLSIKNIDDLRLTEMERRTIELADAVKAPSSYILQKYRSYGWAIPKNSIVLPNFVLAKSLDTVGIKRAEVKEIVFFGRLERRKGLWMFCRALDRMKYKLTRHRVTFLGKSETENGIFTADTLVRRSAAWPFPIRLLTNFDQQQAIAYLKGYGRVAVMPSPEDNSPSTILECIQEGIPFIACSGSGGEELLADDTRDTNLFEPSVDELCEKLDELIKRGAFTARSSFDERQLEVAFGDWVADLLNSTVPQPISAETAGPPTLIVVVPPDVQPDQAIAEIQHAIADFDGNVKIELLPTQPERFRQLAGTKQPLPVNVWGPEDFKRVSQSLASGEATVVGVCHVNQILSPIWIERARTCFARNEGISALTGMVGVKQKRNELEVNNEPFVSVVDRDYQIEHYLMGYAPPLFSLAQETNIGFMLLRSELMAKIGDIDLFDKQYGQLKRLEDWVHEILISLYALGEGFELIPDLIVDRPAKKQAFEVFRLEHFMRSLPSKLFGYQPGTDQHVLARLGIDVGLERERAFAHAEYIRDIAERTGSDLQQLPLQSSWESQTRQLANLAHASGQIDLAGDLCAEISLQDEKLKPFDLKQYLHSVGVGEIVNLTEIIAAGWGVRKVGSKDLELWGPWDRRSIPMDVDPTAPAGYVLQSVNLAKITHFTTVVSASETGSNRVRIRVELVIQDKRVWSAERILDAGEEYLWTFECPKDFRALCTVNFGAELADWQSTQGSRVNWINPQFVRW